MCFLENSSWPKTGASKESLLEMQNFRLYLRPTESELAFKELFRGFTCTWIWGELVWETDYQCWGQDAWLLAQVLPLPNSIVLSGHQWGVGGVSDLQVSCQFWSTIIVPHNLARLDLLCHFRRLLRSVDARASEVTVVFPPFASPVSWCEPGWWGKHAHLPRHDLIPCTWIPGNPVYNLLLWIILWAWGKCIQSESTVS